MPKKIEFESGEADFLSQFDTLVSQLRSKIAAGNCVAAVGYQKEGGDGIFCLTISEVAKESDAEPPTDSDPPTDGEGVSEPDKAPAKAKAKTSKRRTTGRNAAKKNTAANQNEPKAEATPGEPAAG